MRSAGLSLLSRALPASSLMFEEIPCSPSLSTFGTNGVSSPDSVWTATLMSTLSYCRMKLSIHEALSSGTSRSASAEAFMTKSLTEILYSSPPAALICARVLRRTQQSASEYQRRGAATRIEYVVPEQRIHFAIDRQVVVRDRLLRFKQLLRNDLADRRGLHVREISASGQRWSPNRSHTGGWCERMQI